MLNTSVRNARKLKGKTLAELFVRGSQLVASRFEQSFLSGAAEEPKLCEVCLTTTEPSARSRLHIAPMAEAFTGLAELTASANTIRRRWPESVSALIAKADAIAAGHFGLLGYDDLFFGEPIDWRLDPITGRRAPLRHWSRIDFLDSAVVGDHKVVWELNRHQHFVTLGQAYCLTGDDRYAQAFTTQLVGWMDENPPTCGMNWASSLEVSFRAIAWIWALALFRDSHRLTEKLRMRAIGLLHVHGRHVERYLSTYFSPNTHLTGEALGLVYLGTFLPQLKRAERWRWLGWRILNEQIKRHVLSDGVYFEQASYYQRYTADFYLHLFLIGGATSEDVGHIRAPLHALLEHLVYLQRPDGTTPYIGDDDGGRLLPLDDRRPNDFRSTLATAAVLLDRSDFRNASASATPELVWMLGPSGLSRFDEMPSAEPSGASRAFSNGGYYVCRDGWTEDANYSVMDCGPHGVDNCGHAHADALAIEIAAHGKTILVDPGTYTYTSPVDERDRFRASAAHNTVTLDGESSSAAAGPFSWTHVARSEQRAWHSASRFDYVEGAHDGFHRLSASATHVRSMLFLRGDYWIVRDQVESSAPHEIVARYQCAEGVGAELHPSSAAAIGSAGDARWLFLSVHTSVPGQLALEPGWVSPAYGLKVPAPRCAFRIDATPNADLLTALIPFSRDEFRPDVTTLQTSRGSGLVVRRAESEDILLIGGHDGAAAAELETDARWAWVRRAPDGGDVRELILIDGQRVALDGLVVCDLTARARWLYARRVGAGWFIECDGAAEQVTMTLCAGAPTCAASAA